MEFKASLDKDKKLIIKPYVEKMKNKNGGDDITIHLPSPLKILNVAKELRNGIGHLK